MCPLQQNEKDSEEVYHFSRSGVERVTIWKMNLEKTY